MRTYACMYACMYVCIYVCKSLHFLKLKIYPFTYIIHLEFWHLDPLVFRKALLSLQLEAKAQIIGGDVPDDATDGVKFT